MLTNDLAAIFADTSVTVPVKFGARCVRGFLSARDVSESDGQSMPVLVPRRTVVVQEGALPGLGSGDALTVNNVAYRLHGEPRSDGRGKEILILAEDHA